MYDNLTDIKLPIATPGTILRRLGFLRRSSRTSAGGSHGLYKAPIPSLCPALTTNS